MLEAKNITIAVGERVLVENLSFIANDGELTCITGAAGSGKTTLLRTLMGFLPVKDGFVSVDGELRDDGVSASGCADVGTSTGGA